MITTIVEFQLPRAMTLDEAVAYAMGEQDGPTGRADL